MFLPRLQKARVEARFSSAKLLNRPKRANADRHSSVNSLSIIYKEIAKSTCFTGIVCVLKKRIEPSIESDEDQYNRKQDNPTFGLFKMQLTTRLIKMQELL